MTHPNLQSHTDDQQATEKRILEYFVANQGFLKTKADVIRGANLRADGNHGHVQFHCAVLKLNTELARHGMTIAQFGQAYELVEV